MRTTRVPSPAVPVARGARAALLALVALLACAAPGVEVSPQPGDFAFLEVALQG
jgi:hypothetical protein